MSPQWPPMLEMTVLLNITPRSAAASQTNVSTCLAA